MPPQEAVTIRPAYPEDFDAIWPILEHIIRAGDVYARPRDQSKADAFAHLFNPAHDIFVAESADQVLGAYYLRANQRGPGAHIANCGYMTSPAARGRGIAYAMCQHSLTHARNRGFRAMQFNLVVSTNHDAVHLWQKCGFRTVGTLPGSFNHPTHGYVDAFVMFRELD